MLLALSPPIVDRLTAMPESGMGYQVVDLILADGRVISNVSVFNSELAAVPESLRDLKSSDVADVRLVTNARPQR
jgi:hypothetical protein